MRCESEMAFFFYFAGAFFLISRQIISAMDEFNCGLMPVCGENPKILILGSFPSLKSLEKNEYYGNPKNHFWKIMEAVFGTDTSLSYDKRIESLKNAGIALWDAASECRREKSSDATLKDVKPNDIARILIKNKPVRVIALNGKTGAEKYFKKFHPDFSKKFPDVKVITLPSSSPANARQSLDDKIKEWSALKEYIL